MDSMLVYPAGTTAACRWAASYLQKSGIPIVDHPTPDATHLLLDVPSFSPEGLLRGGGDAQALLRMLPVNITIVGGNLSHSAVKSRPVIDLLQDQAYLAKNAAITADCALRVATQHLSITFAQCPTLVIGWGRIGKCLGRMLQAMGADVTVAARKESDRAMLSALGYGTMEISELGNHLHRFRLVYNTVPHPLLSESELAPCPKGLYVELASSPGLVGDSVLPAKGLPGIITPESSGKLICETFLRLTGRK